MYIKLLVTMTLPRIFIIESLRFKDEKNKLFEGELLSKMLHFSRTKMRYVYIRTRREFKEVIDQFKKSN